MLRNQAVGQHGCAGTESLVTRRVASFDLCVRRNIRRALHILTRRAVRAFLTPLHNENYGLRNFDKAMEHVTYTRLLR